MALALTKDLYEGEARKKLLAYIGVLIPLCPMIAPTMGAFMMQYVSWRGIFVSQALLALPALYGSFRLKETLDAPSSGGIRAALGRYANLARNAPYMVYTLAFAVVNLSFFAFIGGSSDLYIVDYGLTKEAFGLYFAFNALALMLGSLMCSRLCVGIESFRILIISLLGMTVAAGIMVVFGGPTPMHFALPMFAYSFFLGLSRPISNHVVLEEVHRDTGTASSLLTFFNFLIGAVGMELISFDWGSKPMVIGLMGLGGALFAIAAVLGMQLKKQTGLMTMAGSEPDKDSRPASRPDAMLRYCGISSPGPSESEKKRLGINGNSLDIDAQMQMRAGRPSGRSGQPDFLPAPHHFSFLHHDF